MEKASLIEFPCDFPIKAMGAAQAGQQPFRQHVERLIDPHVEQEDLLEVRVRPSRNGRYIGVTLTIRAHSQAQLDAIYEDLSADAQVLVAL